MRHLIAHGASPDAQGLGLSVDREAAVVETCDFLSRVIKLKPVKTVGDQELYETSKVFQPLAARKGQEFPALVQEMLLDKKLIRFGIQVRPQPHGNVERYEGPRTQVLHAMIRVLADPGLHPTCRKDGAVDSPVIGTDIARTVIASQQALFDGGKSPLKPGTIAKLFNEIVPPQIG